MAIKSFDDSNYLFRAAAVWPGALPFMVSAWANGATGIARPKNIYSLAISGTANQKRELFNASNDHLQCRSCDGAACSGADIASPTWPNNTWTHTFGAWIASNNRYSYINGGNRANDTVSRTVSSPNRTCIGTSGNNVDGNSWDVNGGLAEVSVWDATGFSLANQDSLASKLYNGGAGGAGGNPININNESAQPWTGKLVAYWPLTTTTDLANALNPGTNDLTMQGTLTNFASHPNIEAV